MGSDRLHWDKYEKFEKRREDQKGYEFQHAPSGSAPTPVVTFAEKLKWWTWDRWRRMDKIRQARDQRVLDIVNIKKTPPTP
jgi:hypothetical protein